MFNATDVNSASMGVIMLEEQVRTLQVIGAGIQVLTIKKEIKLILPQSGSGSRDTSGNPAKPLMLPQLK